jgi:enamine deaminase RidA (YjgF/YER057c/UK114 family)
VYNRAVTAVENLQRLGMVVPEPPAAVGAYVTWVRTGNLVLTSGQNAIAQLKSATGDLERIRRIVRLEGYVHCAPGFRDHPKILDGASDLLLEIFEERGKHVRIALGIPDMPLNACVQLGVWAEVSD